MGTELISSKQGISIIILFLIGSALVSGLIAEAKQDIWLSFLLAYLMAIPILFLYSKLIKVIQGKDIFEISFIVFGSFAGRIIVILLTWYFFHMGAMQIRSFSEFVNIISFPESPQYIILIPLGLLCIWCCKAGIEVLGRFSIFVLPFVVLIIISVLLLSITKVHLENLKPILYEGMKPVISNAFLIFTNFLSELVVFTALFSSLEDKKKSTKVIIIGSFVSWSLLLLVSVRNILVLGVQTATSLYFSTYMAVRTINIGEFLQRFEFVTAGVYIFGAFVKVSVCMIAATKGAGRIFNIEKRNHLAVPIGFLMMNLANILYKSMMELYEWSNDIYKYYAVLFQIILPVIILIGALIKTKNKESSSKQNSDKQSSNKESNKESNNK